MMCQDMNNCTPPPTYQMIFQTQQQMQSQHQSSKYIDGGGQGNGCSSYRGKRKGNLNCGNGGNYRNSFNPENKNSNLSRGKQHRPWRRHLTTVKFIDPKNIKAFNNDNYCWTHGGKIANNHTIQTCSKQHPSGMHNANATRKNMMGGVCCMSELYDCWQFFHRVSNSNYRC